MNHEAIAIALDDDFEWQVPLGRKFDVDILTCSAPHCTWIDRRADLDAWRAHAQEAHPEWWNLCMFMAEVISNRGTTDTNYEAAVWRIVGPIASRLLEVGA